MQIFKNKRCVHVTAFRISCAIDCLYCRVRIWNGIYQIGSTIQHVIPFDRLSEMGRVCFEDSVLTHLTIFQGHFFRPLLLYLAFLYITQILLTHFCFLQKDETGERVLALDNRYGWVQKGCTCIDDLIMFYFRKFFFNFHYFMIFGNAGLGVMSSILRVLKAVIYGLWVLPRLDMSTLGREFEQFDSGLCSFYVIHDLTEWYAFRLFRFHRLCSHVESWERSNQSGPGRLHKFTTRCATPAEGAVLTRVGRRAKWSYW